MKRKNLSLAVFLAVIAICLPLAGTAFANGAEEDPVLTVAGDDPVVAATFTAQSFSSDTIKNYWLYTPADPKEDMPLIVYLHGGSGKGNDLSLLTDDGFPKYLQDGDLGDVRAYVIMPQLPSEVKGWPNAGADLLSLISSIRTAYGIPSDKVSLTGHSMGGTGTWSVAAQYPKTFSRIAPCSGSINNTTLNVNKLKNLSVRAFVGSADVVVSPDSSINFVAALVEAGGDAEITSFEGASHTDVPALAYLDEELGLVNWLSWDEDPEDDGMNMFDHSEFIEKEQPELNEETKALISSYQRDPSEENYLALRDAVIANYDLVVARKEAKLAELIQDTQGKPGGEDKVANMVEIVQDIYVTYWNRINSSMLRFTDSRLLSWKISEAANYEYIPVMGAGNSISVKRTPVTCAEYAAFVADTGYDPPSNWTDGAYPAGEEDFPVNFVSFEDAEAYCDWLTQKDGVNTYRLPSESEWELAAGHMPKDADFNCGVNDERVSVFQYASATRGAHGAVDFWGNVWEWTSTVRSGSTLGIKGGSWKSPRTDCRTEYRLAGRPSSGAFEDVGFRVIRVEGGVEPEQKVELYTLDAPAVSALILPDGDLRLTWNAVPRAVDYQVYAYNDETGLFCMLDRTDGTEMTLGAAAENNNCRYLVQALSYTEMSDNVAAENAVAPTGSPAAIMYGDANGDGDVSNKDIVRLKNYLANFDDETGVSTVDLFPGADANGDGAVNNKDIVRLKNYFANYDDETGFSTVSLGPQT